MPDVLHTGLLFPSQPSTTRAITCLASPVRAEEKVARSSSHLIHFPADIFSSLQRNTGRRNRCQRFFTPDCCFRPSLRRREPSPVSRLRSGQRKRSQEVLHTLFTFPRIFSPAFRGTPGGETGARGSSHRIFSRLGLRQRKRSQEVLHTLFIFPRIFSPILREHREAKPVQEVLHAGFSLVSDYGRGKGRKKFFTPYLYSRRCFLQPSEDAGKRNHCKRFFTPDSDRARAQ